MPDISDAEKNEADKWILIKLNNLIVDVVNNMEKYELGLAVAKIDDFVWSYFCDWYIELTKPVLYGDDMRNKNSTLSVLIYVLDKILKLLHPFIPFITEEIYGNLFAGGGSIMVKEFPDYCSKFDYLQESEHMDIIIDTLRQSKFTLEMNVPPSRGLVNMRIEKQILKTARCIFKSLQMPRRMAWYW